MRLTGDEIDRRTREALERLRAHGKSWSLAVCRDLMDIGYDAPTAWLLVEKVLVDTGEVIK